MNQLLAIWCEKGLPLNFSSEEYDSTIAKLQKQLDGIYEAFTGDCGHAEISQVDVEFVSKNTHDIEIVEEDDLLELEEESLSPNTAKERLSRAPPRCLFV